VRAAVLVGHEGGLGDGLERLDHAAVDGRERLGEVAAAHVADGLGFGGEGLDDAAQPLGIEDLDGLGERPQRGPGAAELALHVLQRAGLLQGPQGSEDGVEEEE
jgi:hypothetical protein